MRNRDAYPIQLALVFVCLCGAVQVARAQTDASPLPAPTGFVNDYANVIEPATKSRLETILTNLDRQQNIQCAVVTVKTTGDQDIFNYSLAVSRGWGIGSKEGEKNGVLLLVAIDDRKYFTQVSRHLEGDLPDGLVGQIQRERLVPQFKQGHYSQGIFDTMQTYVATLAEKRGFNVAGLDQSQAYHGSTSRTRNDGGDVKGFSPLCIGLIILFFLILIFSKRGGGGRGGGCLNLLLFNALLNSGRGSSSGWGGGGFGGGGGGGGGFGGFGGGDFGGGGAGGSW